MGNKLQRCGYRGFTDWKGLKLHVLSVQMAAGNGVTQWEVLRHRARFSLNSAFYQLLLFEQNINFSSYNLQLHVIIPTFPLCWSVTVVISDCSIFKICLESQLYIVGFVLSTMGPWASGLLPEFQVSGLWQIIWVLIPGGRACTVNERQSTRSGAFSDTWRAASPASADGSSPGKPVLHC